MADTDAEMNDLSDDELAALEAASDRVGATPPRPNKFIGDADEAKALVAAMQRGVDGGDTPPDACPTE